MTVGVGPALISSSCRPVRVFSFPKLSIAFLALGALASQALALDGRVVDSRTGQPVARAEVTILGWPGVVFTDADGRFSWKPDPKPPFEVLVILPGERYMKPVLVEAVPEGQVLTIEVLPLLEETVTVAAGAAADVEATPASGTTLLTARDIQSRQPATLVQALENVAGVSSASEGRAAVPVVRGLARGRTLILIDGARVSTERRAGASATFLDPFVLDGVEVARGPGSVAYGSDAFGGVIYARTRRIEPGAPLGVRAIVGLGAGTPEQQVGIEVSRGVAQGGFLLQGHYRNFEDYRSPEGTVFNSGASDGGFLVRASHTVGRGVLTAAWQVDLGRDIERPRDNSTTVRFLYPVEDSYRFTTSYEIDNVGGFQRVGASAFLGSYRLVTDQERAAASGRPRTLERADVSANDFHARGFGERFVGPTRVEVGVDVNGRFDLNAEDISQVFDAAGRVIAETRSESIENASRIDWAGYAMVEAALAPALTLAGGIRGDEVDTDSRGATFGDRTTSNGAVSGYISATAGSFGGWSVTGQVARGFRDPTLSDRYFSGPSGRGSVTGNPDLQPETSLQFDVAVRFTASRYRVAVYAYHYRIDDLIERYETAPDTFTFRNRGQARIRGVELELQGDLGSGWSLEAAGQLSRGVALDDDAPLDDIPPPTLSLLLRKQLGERFQAQLRGAFFADDDRPGPTEVPTPGYVLVDAGAGFTVNRHLDLRLTVRNLLDRSYPESPDPRAMPAPGIAAVITALVRF